MSQTPTNPDHQSSPNAPRWVKMLGLIALALLLIFVALHLIGIEGMHGPGRHIPTIEHGVQQP